MEGLASELPRAGPFWVLGVAWGGLGFLGEDGEGIRFPGWYNSDPASKSPRGRRRPQREVSLMVLTAQTLGVIAACANIGSEHRKLRHRGRPDSSPHLREDQFASDGTGGGSGERQGALRAVWDNARHPPCRPACGGTGLPPGAIRSNRPRAFLSRASAWHQNSGGYRGALPLLGD